MRSILLVFLFLTTLAFGQARRVAVYDLRSDFKMLKEGAYVPYDGSSSTLHYTLDADRFRSYWLEVEGPREFSVWINSKLVRQSGGGVTRFSIDSLSRLYGTKMSLSIYAQRGHSLLRSTVVSYTSLDANEEEPLRQSTSFRDFSVLAVFILSLGFLSMIRFNRRMLFDYFDFTRLLSLQERDESLVAGRVTSRFSLLIYFFLCAWAAFLFLIIFQRAGEGYFIFSDFTVNGLGGGFMQWGKLTLLFAVILFIKVVVVLSLAVIFRLREGGSIQVLNYFRLISFLLMILSLVLVIYFMAGTKAPGYYQALVSTSAWVMTAWGLLIFLKLLNKAPYSVFHLFSYLCASEYFPMIILFKSVFL